MNPSEMFKQAVTHHQAGRFAEAEELYRSVLQDEPTHPDANHNLGLMAMQSNQPEMGLPYLQAAWEADPSIGQYWLTLTECLLELSHTEDALLLIEDALRRGLDSPQAQQLLMRAKGCYDTKTKPADTIIDEAVETMSVNFERHAQATEQSNTERQAVKESPSVLSAVTQTGKKTIRAKPATQDKSAIKSAPHQKENPGIQEKNMLVTLFTEGRYAETEILARTMTQQYPQHGFGWKVLGAVLKQTGRDADALIPMQKAAALSPSDAEVHNNLGVLLQTQGQLKAALVSMRRALKLKPDYANAHNSLGSILDDMGRFDAAQSSYRRALEINPDFAYAHNNLGAILKNRGEFDAAAASLRRAIAINPDFAKAHNNLGIVLNEQGQPDAAQACYRRALELEPDFAEALCNLGHSLCDLGDLDQAAVIYQKVLGIDPANSGLDAAVYLAILHYLDGNFEQCRSNLLASQPIMAKADPKHKNARSYWSYLDKLLSWQQRSIQKSNQTQSIKTLYVIGESHSLSAHGAVVSYNGQEMRCAAKWISGCKQWHLGNSEANKYKYKFEAVMARLPRESVILLSIGEIDCRHDEGIIKVWEKYPNKALAEIMQSTVDAYLNYVAAIGAHYGHKIIVGGVPATNIPLDSLGQSTAEQLIHLIRIFNTALKSQALAAGMDFLDVYALTDRGDGIASGEWHIDGDIHLQPSAVVEVFGRHCTLHQ